MNVLEVEGLEHLTLARKSKKFSSFLLPFAPLRVTSFGLTITPMAYILTKALNNYTGSHTANLCTVPPKCHRSTIISSIIVAND